MTHEQALRTAIDALTAELKPEGHWVGELSSSALAGAVAVIALHLNGAPEDATAIEEGVRWICRTQNEDGGWGDCPKSLSNPSTTLLVLSALKLTGRGEESKAASYLRSVLGDDIAAGIRQIYGEDHTFSVPILMVCALAGLVGWDSVPRLPYPLAAMPYQIYNMLKLQVVSYAMPALIAVGLAVDKKRGQSGLGRLVEKKVLRLLEQILPDSGGFLEAVPLTAFVSMALLSFGSQDQVVTMALEFLRKQQHPDGSWPIDANLAQWVTSCAVNALRAAGAEPPQSAVDWILANQTKAVHPFTHAAPGGWGWTDLSGSVPDGDDTSAALLAIRPTLDAANRRREAGSRAARGLLWLVNLQNADGGWPPFCRGWGRLPFDQSCADITAHALRAIAAYEACWQLLDPEKKISNLLDRMKRAEKRGFDYLAKTQHADGSWVPLWFGSQLTRSNENPVFGTSRVLMAYGEGNRPGNAAEKGLSYILRAQNADGGWGAAPNSPSMIQETSLALSALSLYREKPDCEEAVQRGLAYLIRGIEQDGLKDAQPIGLYFAKLWYSEKLYPMIWSVEALGRCLNR